MAKYNWLKNRRRKSSSMRTYIGRGGDEYLWGLSGKYAERMYGYKKRRATQMGIKLSPLDKQKSIRENTKLSYQLAKKDVNYMRFLIHKYDSKDYWF